MKYSELIGEIASEAGTSQRQTAEVLSVLRDTISQELASGGEIVIPGVGKFVLSHRAERKGRNPQTGEVITIPARQAVRFKPAQALKNAVAG